MNTPNKLTVGRIIATPFFMAALMIDFPYHYTVALILFIAASLTDMIDGKMARKYNMITDFGKFLDPLADKMMTITVFICITIRGIIPWWVILLLFAKDFLMILGGIKLYHEVSGVFAANVFGKAATVFLVLGGVTVMLFNDWLPLAIKNAFIYIAVAMSFLAFFSYLYQYIHFKRTKDTSKL